jgi:PAS domain S-box-containing protein
MSEVSHFNDVLEHRVKKRTEKLKQLVLRLRQDINERKQLETQLEQFFKFFNLAPILQCIIGLDGYFKQVNPAFTQKLGFSTEELLEKPFLELVFPEDRAFALAEVKKLQQQEMTLSFESRYLCKDGSFLWLSWKAFFEPTDQLIYASAYDVTEAKKNAEKLQLAELVYQNSIQAILVTDANNEIIAANPAFTEITGYELDEVIGQNPKIFKSGKHSPEFYQTMWQTLNSEGRWQGEIWDKCKNGRLHAKFLNINRILDKDGQVQCYLALFSDITARKQYEEEIKRLSESELNKAKLEAERASQAKNDFLASMSHELFTPMNAVLGFAQILEYEDLNAEQHENVATILTGGYQLLDLIKEVLDLSKMQSEPLELKLEAIDLAKLVQNCITLVQPLTQQKNITLIDNLTSTCHSAVIADAMRLKQVLLNLISNAIKYNRVDGSITLSCVSINPHTLRVNIIDTGEGLSAEQLTKLFHPFERLSAKNSAIEGAGLGLCISKKLIEAMHGSIGVSSCEGEGSCFWIEIPLSDEIQVFS